MFTPHQLEELVKVFGADHVIMGTDYPYDMGEFDPIGHVRSVEMFDDATRCGDLRRQCKAIAGDLMALLWLQ